MPPAKAIRVDKSQKILDHHLSYFVDELRNIHSAESAKMSNTHSASISSCPLCHDQTVTLTQEKLAVCDPAENITSPQTSPTFQFPER